MEEKNYKIYDSLYNVIGVAPYEEVHTQGLLHQVVHFWLAEKKDDQLWFYLQKRAEDEQLGLFLEKEQLTYIGHIHQQIKKDKYFDNTFVQSYLYVTDHAEKDFADAGNVVKVKFEELAAFTGNPEGKITVYDIQGQPIEETTHDQWWPRDEEFEKVMAPYIEKHF